MRMNNPLRLSDIRKACSLQAPNPTPVVVVLPDGTRTTLKHWQYESGDGGDGEEVTALRLEVSDE